MFRLRSRLSSAGVSPYDLSLVSQDGCDVADPNSGVFINPETFSSHKIGEAVKKVGSSIGDGVESLSDGAKKLFHKIKGDDDNDDSRDREELDNVRVLNGGKKETNDFDLRFGSRKPVTPAQDSEWLP